MARTLEAAALAWRELLRRLEAGDPEARRQARRLTGGEYQGDGEVIAALIKGNPQPHGA